jgi:hypothetical protein
VRERDVTEIGSTNSATKFAGNVGFRPDRLQLSVAFQGQVAKIENVFGVPSLPVGNGSPSRH